VPDRHFAARADLRLSRRGPRSCPFIQRRADLNPRRGVRLLEDRFRVDGTGEPVGLAEAGAVRPLERAAKADQPADGEHQAEQPSGRLGGAHGVTSPPQQAAFRSAGTWPFLSRPARAMVARTGRQVVPMCALCNRVTVTNAPRIRNAFATGCGHRRRAGGRRAGGPGASTLSGPRRGNRRPARLSQDRGAAECDAYSDRSRSAVCVRL
jgi:hypothetical protein